MSDHSSQKHPYHLVNPSPWPVLGAGALLMVTVGAARFMHGLMGGVPLLILGFSLLFYVMFVWWRDITREAEVEKVHTNEVARGLRWGMLFFITSEVMFFAAFFWAFFDASTISKTPIIDDVWSISRGPWPPVGITPFDPWHLPFLNTLVLLLSGCTVTWAHYALLENNRKHMIHALWYTVILGVIFTTTQAYEYSSAAFGFRDGVFASTFFMATGFHGLHVLVGTIFLAVCLIRAKKGHFTAERHLGFEFAAWYWHFVDVVWLFLFICVYGGFINKIMPMLETIFTGTHLAIFGVLSVMVAALFGYRCMFKERGDKLLPLKKAA